jgi:hypothetical protein
MRTMMSAVTLAALALLPAEGRAQPVAPGSRPSQDALVLEVRLLRQAVERQTAAAVRSQLLVSRLAVQHQRVVRAQDAVDRAVDAADVGARKQEQMREALGRLNRVFGEVVEEPRRSELEREIEGLRAQLVDQDRAMSRLRMKQSQTEQSLTAEQRLYGELESSLSSLDRQLQKPGS